MSTSRPYYLRPLALCRPRQWWWRSVRRWAGETCQRCGRMYGADQSLNVQSIWRATDAAWKEITGNEGGGTYCLPCFIQGCSAFGYVAYITVDLHDFPPVVEEQE